MHLYQGGRHVGSNLLLRFKVLGYNYRMTDIQGAVGLVQVKKHV